MDSAGGQVVDADGKPTVDTPQAKKGLNLLVDGFKDGIVPKEAITYQEETPAARSRTGNLVFLRNWPYFGVA